MIDYDKSLKQDHNLTNTIILYFKIKEKGNQITCIMQFMRLLQIRAIRHLLGHVEILIIGQCLHI